MGRIFLFFLQLLAAVPRPASQSVGRLIGQVNYFLDTRSCQVTRTNLELCRPDMTQREREQLCRQSLIHTGQTAMETPAAWLGNAERLRNWIVRVEGESCLDDALASERGVIFLLPHLGNWELFNVFIAGRCQATALYHPPRQTYMQEPMRRVREQFGTELVPTDVRGVARLFRALKAGKAVIVLPDQVPASGLYVPFFGVEALTDQLISRLVKKTGATVLACSVIRLADGRFEARFSQADDLIDHEDVAQSMRGVNRTIESLVDRDTEQYQWEYKRFRERPPGERKVYRYNRVEYH